MRYECEVLVTSRYILAIEAKSVDEARSKAMERAGSGADPQSSNIEVKVDQGVG